MSKEILCFADDTTGALDVAGSFHSRGYSASVQIEMDSGLDQPSQARCLVINLNSRYTDPAVSGEKLFQAYNQNASKIASAGSIFLKVDSTLRGNVLADSENLCDLHQDGPVFIAPAFPFYGRTCQDGIYVVKNQPVTDTEFAEDKAFHFSTSFLHDMRPDIEHIDWRLLDEGVDAIIEKVDRSPVRKFTFDTRDQTDLELIADVGIQIDALFIGSSGLARAFPQERTTLQTFTIDSSLPVLFVVGSIHKVSRFQKDALAKFDIKGIDLSLNDIGKRALLSDLKDEVLKYLDYRRIAYIATPEEITADEALWREIEVYISELSAVDEVAHNLVIVGGETTRATLRGRRISVLSIRGEYEPGIPISNQRGKEELIFTKAGGFGHSNTLIDIYRYISGREYERST